MSTRRPGFNLPPGDTMASYSPPPIDLSSRIRGCARGSRAEQAGAEHTRSVDDEHVLRLDELHDVSERSMRDCPCCSVNHHQATRVALVERLLGDLIRGEIEVVVGCALAGHIDHNLHSRSEWRSSRGATATKDRSA